MSFDFDSLLDDLDNTLDNLETQEAKEVIEPTKTVSEEFVEKTFTKKAIKEMKQNAEPTSPDTEPDYYNYLIEKKDEGKCTIRRSRDKIFRLYVSKTIM